MPLTVDPLTESESPVGPAVGVLLTVVLEVVPEPVGATQRVRFGPEVDEMDPLFTMEDPQRVLQAPEAEEMEPPLLLVMVPVAVRLPEKLTEPLLVKLPVIFPPPAKELELPLFT